MTATLTKLPMPVPDHERIRTYAEASGDMNPLHLDPEAARKVGFPDVISHGMLVMGLALSTLKTGLGADRITTSHVRFSAPVLAGTELFLSAEVDGTSAEFKVQTCDETTVLMGRATFSKG
ncbi:MaoC family dehydratase [Ruegeria sp.]|uniref:MaoC family dehydratase n=1 Tax=Ruegeria sp. TaxID=1879320 RepID=UPI003C7C21A4